MYRKFNLGNNLNRGENMIRKRKLKSAVIYGMYALSIAMLLGGVYFIEGILDKKVFEVEEIESVEEVSEVLEDNKNNDIPVVSTEVKIARPYSNGNVKTLTNYYDYKGEQSEQENAIIYYGNTYMQNSGVDYGMEEEFEVISILDGTVMEVVDDEIMGKTLKIKHSNDLISVYQSMGSIDVKVDDAVTQGMIVGKSGESNVSSDLGNHLHFELYYKGEVVNPEEYYDKLVGQLQ